MRVPELLVISSFNFCISYYSFFFSFLNSSASHNTWWPGNLSPRTAASRGQEGKKRIETRRYNWVEKKRKGGLCRMRISCIHVDIIHILSTLRPISNRQRKIDDPPPPPSWWVRGTRTSSSVPRDASSSQAYHRRAPLRPPVNRKANTTRG